MSEIINRIPSHYVSQTCAQIMIPYSSTITLLNKDGIVFNKDKRYDFINKYLENELRKIFPYDNIPNHIKRQGLFGNKINLTNQILNFDEHYISISDGVPIDRYVIKDDSTALFMTKVLPYNINDESEYINKYETMTREQLNSIFKPSNESEKVYLITSYGELYHSPNMGYLNEEELLEAEKEKYIKELEKAKPQFSKNTIEFLKTKIENMQLSDLQNIPLPPLCYIVRIDGTNIKLQLIYTELLISNRYMVTIKNIPLNKYVLEQFKYMAPNIIELKEPKIPLRLNPGIKKQDITEAKQKVLRMKNQ